MKKIYNLFLCAIVFSVNIVKPRDDSNGETEAIANVGGILTSGAVTYAYNMYKKRKYQKAADELFQKHQQERQALDVKHQKEKDRLLDNLANKNVTAEYNLKTDYLKYPEYNPEEKYQNDLDNLKKEYNQNYNKIIDSSNYQKQAERKELGIKQEAEIRARVKNPSKNNQKDIFAAVPDGRYGMTDEKIADLKKRYKDLYNKDLVKTPETFTPDGDFDQQSHILEKMSQNSIQTKQDSEDGLKDAKTIEANIKQKRILEKTEEENHGRDSIEV